MLWAILPSTRTRCWLTFSLSTRTHRSFPANLLSRQPSVISAWGYPSLGTRFWASLSWTAWAAAGHFPSSITLERATYQSAANCEGDLSCHQIRNGDGNRAGASTDPLGALVVPDLQLEFTTWPLRAHCLPAHFQSTSLAAHPAQTSLCFWEFATLF